MHDLMVFMAGAVSGGVSFYIAKRRAVRLVRLLQDRNKLLSGRIKKEHAAAELHKGFCRIFENEVKSLTDKCDALTRQTAQESPKAHYIDEAGIEYWVQGSLDADRNRVWQTISQCKGATLPSVFWPLQCRVTFEMAQTDLDMYAKANNFKEKQD